MDHSRLKTPQFHVIWQLPVTGLQVSSDFTNMTTSGIKKSATSHTTAGRARR
jgi:hypothetical protein